MANRTSIFDSLSDGVFTAAERDAVFQTWYVLEASLVNHVEAIRKHERGTFSVKNGT